MRNVPRPGRFAWLLSHRATPMLAAISLVLMTASMVTLGYLVWWLVNRRDGDGPG